MTIIRRTTGEPTDSTLMPTLSNGVAFGGIKHRWKASDLGADGSAIASWTPSVGSIALTQATGSKQPLVRVEAGVKMARFDGVDDVLKMATAPVEANVLTYAIIMRTTDATKSGIAGLGGGSLHHREDTVPKATRVFYAGTVNKDLRSNRLTTGTTFHTVSMVGDRLGGKHGLTVDDIHGTDYLLGTGPFQGNGLLELGQYAGATYGAIDVLEVLAWNVAASRTQRLAIRTYAQATYPGIVA